MSSRRLVVGAIILDPEQRVMAARRMRPDSLAGRWEFPGGKVEPGEAPKEALARELREELRIRVQVHAELDSGGIATGQAGLGDGAWPIDDELELRVWFCSLVAGEPVVGETHDEVVWLDPEDLPTLDWLPADLPVAEALAARSRATASRPAPDERA